MSVRRDERSEVFFFSSRRRHTRFTSDWSSDVCSSDLETDILHEIKTYNELLGDSGELGCTLLIEIDDPDEREEKLTQWLELPKHLYLSLEDETRIMASFDERQIGDARLSSVQYIKFNTGGKTPIAIGSDLPLLKAETTLTNDQKKALSEDLL